MSTLLRGIAGAPGVAVGVAVVLRPPAAPADAPSTAGGRDASHERARWREARARVEAALLRLAERAREVVGAEEAAIFEAQALMATDPDLEEQVDAAIAGGQPAEAATRAAIEAYSAAFAALEDEYMRQRADDVREIGGALLRALQGQDPVPLAELPPGAVLCAAELAAGALVMLDRERLAGIAVGTGGVTSHVAILARTLGVPAVLGLGDFLGAVTDGMRVALDGGHGEVVLAPEGEQLAALTQAAEARAAERQELAALAGQPATTPDGISVDLWANIGSIADVKVALEAGATGVGLFRTEFLIVGRETLPGEDEQQRIYRQALQAMGGRPIIFRTFDIGGDKPVPALALPHEENPFLGYRAVRIGLDRTELLVTQMRALLRAAAETGYPAWIMLPMVTTRDEVRRARELYRVAQGDLTVRVPLGIMIETPAAALIASVLAREVEFFSLGTNDLVQYTMAADRTDDRLSALYQPFHPGVLRLISMAAAAAAAAGIPCGVCGEMGGDPRATALLLGLGVNELSMSAGALGYVKREVRRTPLAAARQLAREALACGSAAEVEARVDAFRDGLIP